MRGGTFHRPCWGRVNTSNRWCVAVRVVGLGWVGLGWVVLGCVVLCCVVLRGPWTVHCNFAKRPVGTSGRIWGLGVAKGRNLTPVNAPAYVPRVAFWHQCGCTHATRSVNLVVGYEGGGPKQDGPCAIRGVCYEVDGRRSNRQSMQVRGLMSRAAPTIGLPLLLWWAATCPHQQARTIHRLLYSLNRTPSHGPRIRTTVPASHVGTRSVAFITSITLHLSVFHAVPPTLPES